MLQEIEELLKKYHFEFQNTSSETQKNHPHLRPLNEYKLSQNDAAKLFIAYPDYFVVHKTLNIKQGSFFIFTLKKGNQIPDNLNYLIETYYPVKTMIVYKSENKLVSQWFGEMNKPVCLEKALEKLVKTN